MSLRKLQPKVQTKVQATLLVASTMTIMAGATISPSMPNIEKIFHVAPNSYWLVPLILTMPGLFIGIIAPFAGWIIDHFGRKKPMIIGLLLYALSGSSGLYLNELWSLLTGRAFLGLAVALVMTSTTTLIADYFSGEQRDRFLGLQSAFMGLGGLLFLLSGGWLADYNWRAPFAIYLLALFLIPCVWLWIQEPSREQEDLAVQEESQIQEGYAAKVVLIYALAFIGMMVFYLIPVELPSLLQVKLHASALKAGAAIGFAAIFSSVTSLLYPQFRPYLSHLSLYGSLFLLMGAGFFILSVAQRFPHVILGAIFCGMGFGLLFPNSTVWLTNSVPAKSRGRFVGGLSSSLFLGQFIVPLVYQPIVQACGWQAGCGVFNVTCFFSLGLAILLYLAALSQGMFFSKETDASS